MQAFDFPNLLIREVIQAVGHHARLVLENASCKGSRCVLSQANHKKKERKNERTKERKEGRKKMCANQSEPQRERERARESEREREGEMRRRYSSPTHSHSASLQHLS